METKLVVVNRKSKSGNSYIALVAKNGYSETKLTFDRGVIAMLLPEGLHIAHIPEGETVIGEIYETV